MLDKAFQQANPVTVLALPVAVDASADQAQEMRSQMRHSNPGQHQKTHVIGQEMKMALSAGLAPTNELIAWGALPSGRAKDQTRHRSTRPITSQILKIFPDGTAITQVMILLQQMGQQPSLHRGLDRRQLHWAHLVQRPLKEGLSPQSQLPGRRGLRRAAAPAALSPRKLKQTSTFQFNQQRPGGHVFELSGGITPVPLLGNMDRQAKATPSGVARNQLPNPLQLFGSDPTTLNVKHLHPRIVLSKRRKRVRRILPKFRFTP
jgi:hypothetical protein